MKRVLVTGAGGQLGKSIQNLASKYPSLEFLFLDKKGMDIRQAGQVMKYFSEFHPDYCINCAAYTNVDQAERTPEPAYAINALGVENIVKACIQFGTTLIHISTDYVFDGQKEEGYLPSDQPNPINVYGKSKLGGERIIQDHLKAYVIVRTSWLYSRKHPPNFYLTILDRARRGEELVVTDSQRGCPTDAGHLARNILKRIDSGNMQHGVFHFTDGLAMTWFEFAEQILKDNGLLGRAHLVKGDNNRNFAQRPKCSILRS